MKIYNLTCFLFSMVAIYACAGELTNISVLVTDHTGKPLENVHVTFSFFSESSDTTSRGFTDKYGQYEASKISTLQTGFYLRKPGYYDTHGQFSAGDKDETIVLKEIIEPIPMYAKKEDLWTGRYELNKWIGYDVFQGDFVTPYGSGLVSDIQVKHNVDRQDMWNYHVDYSIRFPNEHDGLHPYFVEDLSSNFKSEYSAPKSGYLNTWNFYKKRTGNLSAVETNFNKSRKYYFRVRTEVDEQGSVVSAFYGKIYSEFGDFHYYLNPNRNDRNVEFDVGNNLFHNLSLEEEVREP